MATYTLSLTSIVPPRMIDMNHFAQNLIGFGSISSCPYPGRGYLYSPSGREVRFSETEAAWGRSPTHYTRQGFEPELSKSLAFIFSRGALDTYAR
jgi:hypothetical protein